jgi:hypothetical protein
LILFNAAGESVIISGAGCPKMGTPAAVVDRDLHPIQAFLNAIQLDDLSAYRTSALSGLLAGSRAIRKSFWCASLFFLPRGLESSHFKIGIGIRIQRIITHNKSKIGKAAKSHTSEMALLGT